MARELEKQNSTTLAVALDVVAFEMEGNEEHDPLMLVYGGDGGCSVFNLTPRLGAELLLMLEKVG